MRMKECAGFNLPRSQTCLSLSLAIFLLKFSSFPPSWSMNLDLYPVESTPNTSENILKGLDPQSGEVWLRLPYNDADSCKVAFDHAAKWTYEATYFFTITLAATVPRGVRLLLLFPDTRAVLDTSKVRDVAAINRVISANLGKDPKTTQAVLCVGDALYKVSGVSGRLYMHWAETLEYANGRTPTRWRNTPILASTDTHFGATGLYPVFGQHKRHSFIPRGCETFYTPAGFVVWSLGK